jgi:hypothetical protein
MRRTAITRGPDRSVLSVTARPHSGHLPASMAYPHPGQWPAGAYERPSGSAFAAPECGVGGHPGLPVRNTTSPAHSQYHRLVYSVAWFLWRQPPAFHFYSPAARRFSSAPGRRFERRFTASSRPASLACGWGWQGVGGPRSPPGWRRSDSPPMSASRARLKRRALLNEPYLCAARAAWHAASSCRRRQNSAWLTPLRCHSLTSRCQYAARSEMPHLRRRSHGSPAPASRRDWSSAHALAFFVPKASRSHPVPQHISHLRT